MPHDLQRAVRVFEDHLTLLKTHRQIVSRQVIHAPELAMDVRTLTAKFDAAIRQGEDVLQDMKTMNKVIDDQT